MGSKGIEDYHENEVIPIVRYKAQRNLYTDMWYATTHHCRCKLTVMSGQMDIVLNDFNSIFSMTDQNGQFMCSVILATLSTLIDYVNFKSDASLDEIVSEVLKENAKTFNEHMDRLSQKKIKL